MFGPNEIEPLLARRVSELPTSRLLPDILRLKAEGLSHARIGGRLGITKKAIEHALARWRKRTDTSS